MIVVDVNVLVYLWLPDPLSVAAMGCYARDPQWAAPLLWRSEFCNVLALYLRKGLLDMTAAKAAYHNAEITLKEQEFAVTVEEVLNLVSQSTCTSYDCEYVALAQRLGVKLVTKDAKLIKAFPRVAIDLEVFVQA
jgi:predicted nucleic acid-binding protein